MTRGDYGRRHQHRPLSEHLLLSNADFSQGCFEIRKASLQKFSVPSGVVANTHSLIAWIWRQGDQEFKTRYGYIVNSGTA